MYRNHGWGYQVQLHTFEEAMKFAGAARNRHLMLGNGFSISLKPDIFSYGSLFDNADFTDHPHLPDLFAALGTNDFEVVIKNLMDAAKVLEVYAPWEEDLIQTLKSDSAAVKDALVTAIAKRHPDRPQNIDPAQYAACRKFLSAFANTYTLNYDVLLYWSLMQEEVDDLAIRPDDGFRHPEDNPDEPYVSWQQSHSPTVYYMHGALHIFDAGNEIIKYTWSKTSIAIVDQIRSSLDDGRFPLFVAEGTSQSKFDKILHNAYLHKALRSFEACCNSATTSLVIFGHSLADNDDHILRFIARGKIPTLLVSVYGDPGSDYNKSIELKANKLIAYRQRTRSKSPLDVYYYDAATAHVWG